MEESAERLGGVFRDVERVTHDLYGNGQVGFIQEAREFFIRADERAKNEEKQRNLRDQEIKDRLEAHEHKLDQRLGIGAIIIAILTLVLGVLTFIEGNKQLHGIFSLTPSLTVVSSTQAGGIPPN